MPRARLQKGHALRKTRYLGTTMNKGTTFARSAGKKGVASLVWVVVENKGEGNPPSVRGYMYATNRFCQINAQTVNRAVYNI